MIDSQERILLSGYELKDKTHHFIVCCNSDGTIDKTFGDNGFISTLYEDGSMINELAIQPDGSIVVAGSFTKGISFGFISRYDSQGLLDTQFGDAGKIIYKKGVHSNFLSLLLDEKGNIFATGTVIENNYNQLFINKFDSKGTLDESFAQHGEIKIEMQNFMYPKITTLKNENSLIVATALGSNLFAAQYNLDGQKDENFGNKGCINIDIDDNFFCKGLDKDLYGNLFIWGSSAGKTCVISLKKDGSINTDFGDNGSIRESFGKNSLFLAGLVHSGDKIILAGVAEKKAMLVQYRMSNAPSVKMTRNESEESNSFTTNLIGHASIAFAQIDIIINGELFKTVTSDADGVWDAGISPLLQVGENVIELQVKKNNIVLAQSKCMVPVKRSDYITVSNIENSYIFGTSSKANEKVALYIDNQFYTEAVTDKDGSWKALINDKLVNGKHILKATLIIKGKVVADVEYNFTIKIKDSITIQQINNICSLTSNLKVQGISTQPYSKLLISLNGTLLDSCKTNNRGEWCSGDSLKLPLGNHLLMFYLTNEKGDILASACRTVCIKKAPLVS